MNKYEYDKLDMTQGLWNLKHVMIGMMLQHADYETLSELYEICQAHMWAKNKLKRKMEEKQ